MPLMRRRKKVQRPNQSLKKNAFSARKRSRSARKTSCVWKICARNVNSMRNVVKRKLSTEKRKKLSKLAFLKR